jgi:hypothetical protein
MAASAIAREIIAILGGGRGSSKNYKPITLGPKGKAFCGEAKRQGRTGPCTWDVTIRGRQCGKRFCPEFGSVFRWRQDGNPNLPGLPRYLGRCLKRAFPGLTWHFDDKEHRIKEKIFDLSGTFGNKTSKCFDNLFLYKDLTVALESEYQSGEKALEPEIHKVVHSSAKLKVFIYHLSQNRPKPKYLYDFIIRSLPDFQGGLLIAASYFKTYGRLCRTVKDSERTTDVQWRFHGAGARFGEGPHCVVNNAACTGRSGASRRRRCPGRGRRAGALR